MLIELAHKLGYNFKPEPNYLSSLHKFIRDKYGYNVLVLSFVEPSELEVCYYFQIMNLRKYSDVIFEDEFEHKYPDNFSDYDECLEAGLLETLLIVENAILNPVL